MNSRKLLQSILRVPLIRCTRASPTSFVSYSLSTFTNGEAFYMKQQYIEFDRQCKNFDASLEQVDPQNVFVNREIKLGNVDVYGFDYDYTLANYTSDLDKFIFNESRNWLVDQMKYPEALLNYEFVNFATRGLHFDVQKGLLMKVDAYHHVQLDTVHRGFTLLPIEEILSTYRGLYLSSDSLKQRITPNNAVMFQLMDFFRLPEVNLLCSIIEHFDRHKINYQPAYVYQDVSTAVARLHKSGALGQAVMADPERFIQKDPSLHAFLHRLASHNKKLFVISNNSAAYIDRGLQFLIGDDWRDMFDVIITKANKPDFFKSGFRLFRRVNKSGTFKDWEGVKSFQHGQFYEGGSLAHLINLTGWLPHRILYFGDHVYSDLADVANTQGWLTGAVIPELEHEISVANKPEFRHCTQRLQKLETIIEKNQHAHSADAKALLSTWLEERNSLKRLSKSMFNEHFGSIFRSFHNHSYFSQRLGQYASLYTSKVTNLLRLPLDHIFFPKRTALPHESSRF